MKKICFLILGLSFFLGQNLIAQDFRNAPPPPGPAPRIEMGKAEQVTFKNGLQVIVVENHKLPQISFQVFVDYPPILEGDQAGYVDIAGQMLARGTTSRTKAQIDEAVDFIGASLNTSANGVSGTSLTKHKDKLLAVLTDVLFNPTFPADEFAKIKTQTLSALASAKDDPNAIASNVAGVLRYGKKHPYGEVVTEETVNNITVEKCKEFYDTYFHPNISYVIITGDITTKEAMDLASKHFSQWQKKEVSRPKMTIPDKPATTQVDFVDKAGAVQSVINITYPVFLKPGADDAIPANVMNTLLGSYFSSRLNANLREDKAYTYGARSVIDSDPYVGSFNAYASVRNEVTDSSLTQFLVEINKLRDEVVSEEELETVKNVMTGNFARSLESPETVARFYLNTARYHLPADYYATYLEKISKVTKEDVLTMAQKYLTPDRAHILVVGNKDEVADKLKTFSPEKRVNFYDVYGNFIDDAGLAVPDGVTANTVLDAYIKALGGKDAMAKIEDVIIDMTTEIQGMSLQSTLYHAAPNKLAMTSKMMGNVMQSSVFNGEKGVNMQMGNYTDMDEQKTADMRIDSRLFPERFYAEMGVKTELKSMELVNGHKAYKLIITYPSGTKKSHYFDLATGLKVREIETEGGETTITNDISDYREVNGVLFPYSVTVTGAMPVPLVLKTESVEVNSGIDMEIFELD